ncbi:MAG: serine/threonine-protein kinase, partial [Vicinamibacterales bacterium]
MTKIKGRYEIKSTLGEGGMGVVLRAYDPPPMDREVAVKTLHEFGDRFALDLFYKECSILKSISHPNIVEIFDMGEFEEDGEKKPFFVMPLLRGQTLDDLIKNASHRLTVDRVVQIITQTCRGLQAAHEHGLVHRDLKPSNLFVIADDSVKIIDFGVAHVVDDRSQTRSLKGTLLYMAPEQLQNKPVSPQSDIFSLGVVCYEALTKRQPFRGATQEKIIEAVQRHVPPPASEINPAVSQAISRAVHKAMAKQPWNRYDSAKEFADTLQKALHNEPIELFDPARIQPRIDRASKALESGDYQFAGEILSELEAGGHIDPQITLLRAQLDQNVRRRTIAQLLESARARYEEEEDPLA